MGQHRPTERELSCSLHPPQTTSCSSTPPLPLQHPHTHLLHFYTQLFNIHPPTSSQPLGNYLRASGEEGFIRKGPASSAGGVGSPVLAHGRALLIITLIKMKRLHIHFLWTRDRSLQPCGEAALQQIPLFATFKQIRGPSTNQTAVTRQRGRGCMCMTDRASLEL